MKLLPQLATPPVQLPQQQQQQLIHNGREELNLYPVGLIFGRFRHFSVSFFCLCRHKED